MFLRNHFVGKSVVALQNVRCFLSLIDKHYNDDHNNDYFDSKYDSNFKWAVWILNLSSPLPLFGNNDFSGISSNTTVIFADHYVNSHDLTAWLVIHCLNKKKLHNSIHTSATHNLILSISFSNNIKLNLGCCCRPYKDLVNSSSFSWITEPTQFKFCQIPWH